MSVEVKDVNTDVVNGTDTSTNTNNEGGDNSTINEKGDNNGVENVNTDNGVEDNTDKDTNIMIPKHRFDEVNNNYKALKQEVENLKNASKKEEPEQVKEEVKQETKQEVQEDKTSPEIEALEEKVKQFETVIDSMVTSKVQTIPEDYRELIPEGLTSEQKLNWINKAEEKGLFKEKEKPKVTIGQPLNHSANQKQETDAKKMNPIQLFASYYGKK